MTSRSRATQPPGVERAPNLKNIPEELRALPQWVCATGKPGKADPEGKRPRSPTTGKPASVAAAATWGTFDDALAKAKAKGWAHVGIVLTADDPYCIVDLDDKAHKPATDVEREGFTTIIEELDSYTERSASGRGYHIIVEADIAKGIHRANVEVYSDARFMICTGDVVRDAPIAKRQAKVDALVARIAPDKASPSAPVPAVRAALPDGEVIDRITASSADAAAMLACDDWAAVGYESQSSADLALMNFIAAFAPNDDQAIRIFRSCPLGQRHKAMRDDYMHSTLAKARDGQRFDTEGAASLFSDTANAQRIVHHMGSYLLFVPGMGWHVWDGARWRNDGLEARRHVGRLGRIVMQEASKIAAKAAKIADRDASERERELAQKLMKFAGQAENVNKMDAAMKAAEPLLRCDADALDADPWALGCTNGVLNLRTGELQPATPEQLITKSTGVEYDPAAACPVWDAFLARIFRQHDEIPAFLQRLAGFWLTGLTDPPYLAVLYGIGANGKSTMTNAVSAAMGEYASAAPPGLLMARYGERHPTELASLQGQRFVVAAESREGGKLDEERIKALTGSDSITARRMREDFYTFRPTHKLALMTNHKPIVRGTDEGIWRRLLLVPFDEVIPEAERDPDLSDKLRDEAPGILRWAVDGARLLHLNKSRIELPAVVADATKEYRTESDLLGEFLSDACIVEAKATTFSTELYGRYESWCDDSGERSMTKTALGLRLKELGYTGEKDKRGQRVWRGLRLRDTGAKYQR